MFVRGASIDLNSVGEADEVAAVVRRLTTDSPFVLARVDRDGDRHRCVFDLKRADLVVGYRSVIELQLSLDREFDIVSVDRQPFLLSSSTTPS